MWSPVSVCKGIDWRQEEKWGEKSTKVTKVTKERGGKKEARSENKVVKIKSKLMRWWWCCFPLHLNPLHLLWRKINKTMEIRCVCACVCLCEKDWELCCFAISVYMHPCSCVSVYVFVFLWACGRALHPYIFLTSGWTLMGHALHTAPSGCACMCVCMCVCLCLRDIPLAYRQDSSCFSAYSVWISIILPVAQRCSLTHLPFHSLSLFYRSLVPTPHICTQHTEQSPHTTITPSQYRFISFITTQLPIRHAPSLHTSMCAMCWNNPPWGLYRAQPWARCGDQCSSHRRPVASVPRGFHFSTYTSVFPVRYTSRLQGCRCVQGTRGPVCMHFSM